MYFHAFQILFNINLTYQFFEYLQKHLQQVKNVFPFHTYMILKCLGFYAQKYWTFWQLKKLAATINPTLHSTVRNTEWLFCRTATALTKLKSAWAPPQSKSMRDCCILSCSIISYITDAGSVGTTCGVDTFATINCKQEVHIAPSWGLAPKFTKTRKKHWKPVSYAKTSNHV